MWTGCDLAGSIDPKSLAREDSAMAQEVVTYDGRELPFKTASFHALWSWQSLEHVENVETSFAEIARVLRPGGLFLGSTSFLEPYHARSTFSYTLYGFKIICGRHGLSLYELAPSMDGLAYLLKKLGSVLRIAEGPDFHRRIEDTDLLGGIRKRLEEEGRAGEWVHIAAQLCGTFRFAAVREN